MRTREIPTTLDNGSTREKMVKYVVNTLRLMESVDHYTLVYMLSQKFPEHESWNFTRIIIDAKDHLKKQQGL